MQFPQTKTNGYSKRTIIADLQRKLSLGEINPLKYLTEMSYQYKTCFKKFEALLPSNDDEIGDLTEIDDTVVATPTNIIPQLSVNERLCQVCLINEVDTLILPCRHIQTCYRCTEIISTEESPRCPVCRGTVEQVLQVFSNYIWGFITTFIRKLCFVNNQSQHLFVNYILFIINHDN